MNKFTKHLLMTLLFIVFSSQQLFAKEKSLVLAFFPYVNASKIMLHNKNLKNFLETELNIPISIVTAKNTKVYMENLRKNSYDILFTAPHAGRYSELYYGYKNIAMTSTKIQGYYLVQKNSTLKVLSDLKGKTIAMASPQTLLHQIALDDLRKEGIINHKNITVSVMKNHLNSIFALTKGFNDAAVTGVKLWNNLPKKYKKDLKVLSKSTKIPGFFVMGNSRLEDTLIQKIKTALLKFHISKKGKKYIFKSFENIDKESSQVMDKYISVFK